MLPFSPTAPARLALHTLAHLRAVAEGIAPAEAARRYLVVADDAGALAAHRAAADAGAAVARRAGLGSRWRLLRVGSLPAALAAPAIPIDEWAEAKGYGDFSLEELLPLYEAECPPAPANRKTRQIERLRAARLALLDELAAFAAAPPNISDAVSLWFPDELAASLVRAGFINLGELRAAIVRGGRWWRGLPAYGPTKARALADHVGALVGWPAAPVWAVGAGARAQAFDAGELVESWILARTLSGHTARAYRREAQRFLMWLAMERRTSLADMTADDCSAYIAFLRNVPVEWISRRHAERFAPGWAPFSGQPSVSSQQHALTVLSTFFSWLVRAGRLARNAWELVNLRLPDDPAAPADDSRAFTPGIWDALLAHLDCLLPAPAARMRWLLVFARACGLRAGELLRARRADFAWLDGACWLRVHGKGARNRLVPVPSAALAATRTYFAARGLDFDDAHPNAPLLSILAASALSNAGMLAGVHCPRPDAAERAARGYLSYATLAPMFKRFVRSATVSLPPVERERADAATLHWLRHTHATRAAESGVPIDVQQANLGHADPRVTARYYRAQQRRRAAEVERVFGDAQ